MPTGVTWEKLLHDKVSSAPESKRSWLPLYSFFLCKLSKNEARERHTILAHKYGNANAKFERPRDFPAGKVHLERLAWQADDSSLNSANSSAALLIFHVGLHPQCPNTNDLGQV
jgi:hypothetical protein